jgi:predicted nucleotidyltransferase
MELKLFLEKIFNKRVDLVLKDVLKEEIKEAILADVVYV